MTVPIFDCTTYLHAALVAEAHEAAWQSLKGDPLLAACVQAEATRHAGKLTARATTNAYIFTLFAGMLALGGGALAIYPSLRQQAQIRSTESLHVQHILQNYLADLISSRTIIRDLFENSQPQPQHVLVIGHPVPQKLRDLEWLASTALSVRTQNSLHDARSSATRLSSFLATVSAVSQNNTWSHDPAHRIDSMVPASTMRMTVEIFDNTIKKLESCIEHLKKDTSCFSLAKLANLVSHFSSWQRSR